MKSFILFVLAALGLLVVSQSLFIVDQTQQAIVLQLGQPQGEPRGPGLHWKTPFIQNVRFFDRRILSVDPDPDQVVISSSSADQGKQNVPLFQPLENPEQENNNEATQEDEDNNGPTIDIVSGEPIIVDSFARYKITDPLQFLKTLRTEQNATSRLESILNDSTRSVLGKTTLPELLSPSRTNVMAEIRNRVNEKITQDQLGIEIVDVRIVRADLTDELRESTVKQMISELQKTATERRAKGEERALEIRSTADKERTVIIAEAQREAERTKGQGDERAIKIYADAFNVDKEFYSFFRSMQAYQNTLANPETRLILSPDSDFFRYFEDFRNSSD